MADLSDTPRPRSRTPSAPTIFRFAILDERARDEVKQAAERAGPLLWLRDKRLVEQIQQADSIFKVLDLVASAEGLAEIAWHERIRREPDVIPHLARRLKASRDITDEDTRDTVRERLIAALRWQGVAAVEALVDCFRGLDDYGQSLICVTLGILGAAETAGLLWSYFDKMKERPQRYFVGALWGLIDLEDPRAAPALTELLGQHREFYELYGFLARVGAAEAVIPLIEHIALAEDENREQGWMALAAIVHRAGREVITRELAQVYEPGEEHQSIEFMMNRLMRYSPLELEEYFSLFYRRPER